MSFGDSGLTTRLSIGKLQLYVMIGKLSNEPTLDFLGLLSELKILKLAAENCYKFEVEAGINVKLDLLSIRSTTHLLMDSSS